MTESPRKDVDPPTPLPPMPGLQGANLSQWAWMILTQLLPAVWALWTIHHWPLEDLIDHARAIDLPQRELISHCVLLIGGAVICIAAPAPLTALLQRITQRGPLPAGYWKHCLSDGARRAEVFLAISAYAVSPLAPPVLLSLPFVLAYLLPPHPAGTKAFEELSPQSRDVIRRSGLPESCVLTADLDSSMAMVDWQKGRPRILLSPAVVNQFPPDAQAFIVAHEIGHIRLGHVGGRRILLSVLVWTLILGLLTIGYEMMRIHIIAGLYGVERLDRHLIATPRAIVSLAVLVGMLSPFQTLLAAWVSRRNEVRANDWTLKTTNDPAGLIRAYRMLAKHSLEDTECEAMLPAKHSVLDTHPTLAETEKQAEDFAREHGIEMT